MHAVFDCSAQMFAFNLQVFGAERTGARVHATADVCNSVCKLSVPSAELCIMHMPIGLGSCKRPA